MKKLLILLVTSTVISVILVTSLGVTAFADNGDEIPPPWGYGEPAPLSGDCVPDGSGFDGEVGNGMGPAPNSGDGIPDGSGF